MPYMFLFSLISTWLLIRTHLPLFIQVQHGGNWREQTDKQARQANKLVIARVLDVLHRHRASSARFIRINIEG